MSLENDLQDAVTRIDELREQVNTLTCQKSTLQCEHNQLRQELLGALRELRELRTEVTVKTERLIEMQRALVNNPAQNFDQAAARAVQVKLEQCVDTYKITNARLQAGFDEVVKERDAAREVVTTLGNEKLALRGKLNLEAEVIREARKYLAEGLGNAELANHVPLFELCRRVRENLDAARAEAKNQTERADEAVPPELHNLRFTLKEVTLERDEARAEVSRALTDLNKALALKVPVTVLSAAVTLAVEELEANGAELREAQGDRDAARETCRMLDAEKRALIRERDAGNCEASTRDAKVRHLSLLAATCFAMESCNEYEEAVNHAVNLLAEAERVLDEETKA